MSAEMKRSHRRISTATVIRPTTTPPSVASSTQAAVTGLTWTILIFAITYTILIMSPGLLPAAFGVYPLMKVGDATDLLAPLIVLPLYWLLFRIREDVPIRVGENIAFLVMAAFWVEGHGMHLSANSIGHLLTSENGNAYVLTEFYDEFSATTSGTSAWSA